jgi:ferritin-like metal-binding protein YciE
MAEGAVERVIRYLEDAHAAEDGALATMRDVAAEATDPDFKAAMEEHINVTQTQAERLEARIHALGGKIQGGKSLINSLIAKGSDLLNVFHDKSDKQTQDAIKAYGLEHFEIAMYTSMKAFADSVGDYETAQLADTIMAEEQLAGERLLRLIPQLARSAVNQTTDAKA